MFRQIVQAVICLAFGLIIIAPVYLALDRLTKVTQSTIFESFQMWNDAYQTEGVLTYTLTVAAATSTITCIIGFWIADTLARYEIRNIALIRAVFVLPFVTPAIVAAMGFLALVDTDSILSRIGLDLCFMSEEEEEQGPSWKSIR